MLRRRLGGIDGRGIALSFLRITVASLALGLLPGGCRFEWDGSGCPVTLFTLTAPSVSAGGGERGEVSATWRSGAAEHGGRQHVYLLVLFVLRAPEIESFRKMLRQRRARAARWDRRRQL